MSVPPGETLNPVENLIKDNVYFVKMSDKAIGDPYLPYKLMNKDEKDENDVVYFRFKRIDGGHTFKIRKDDIDKYNFFELPPKPPARPEGGSRRRKFKKSRNIPRAISRFLSRKYRTRRFRKH